MARKTDYLFQRSGSSNWWIKLQSPGKRVEKSPGTRDKKEAEILAQPHTGSAAVLVDELDAGEF
jgi:hypothetical protein